MKWENLFGKTCFRISKWKDHFEILRKFEKEVNNVVKRSMGSQLVKNKPKYILFI
jgi:hypothetical protein